MSEAKYLKSTCAHCGGHIEFPADGIGSVVPCPHCGWEIELSLDAPANESEAPSRSRKWIVAGLVILLVGIVGVIGALVVAKNVARKAQQQRNAKPAATPAARANPTPAPAANTINDFAVSDVKMEKKPGSTLVYASGTVRNITDKPRFGVAVEVDLLDGSGRKVGTAKDYKESIEPRAEWTYRALIVVKQAVAARVTSITEQQ
jgi:hypothetical protein